MIASSSLKAAGRGLLAVSRANNFGDNEGLVRLNEYPASVARE